MCNRLTRAPQGHRVLDEVRECTVSKAPRSPNHRPHRPHARCRLGGHRTGSAATNPTPTPTPTPGVCPAEPGRDQPPLPPLPPLLGAGDTARDLEGTPETRRDSATTPATPAGPAILLHAGRFCLLNSEFCCFVCVCVTVAIV